MAEESPLSLPSDTSPVGLKRRATVNVDYQDHLPSGNTNQHRTLPLSPRPHLSPVKLIAGFNGVHETRFPTKKPITLSPKKPKLSPLSQNPLPLYQEMKETELLGSKCELVKVFDESLNLGRVDSPKNSSGDRSVEESVVSNKEISNVPSVACELGKATEVPKKSETKEKNQGKPNQVSKKSETVEKNVGLDGFLHKLVKSHFKGLNADGPTTSLKVRVVDEIALIDFAVKGKRFGKRRERKINPNGGRRRFLYSRTEMEALRFLDVKGQRKFWQEIYCNFSETMKKEYDELGTFRHHLKPGRRHENPGIRNNYGQGILGVAATRGTWTYPNLFAY